MPGWELIGVEERQAILDWFEESNGVMFAHGFDAVRNGVYKVRDAQVIGFWMTSFLDNLFQNYISENGGNPKSLVVALNH